MVSTGWTTLSWPRRRAVACRPNSTSISANPTSQIRRRTAWAIRLNRRAADEGADSTPILCSTETRALTMAAVTARR